MSLEHIWPRALGGANSPDLFKSNNVCTICNTIAGQWVDGAFLKSWFISHEIAVAARHYLDPLTPGIAPLIYQGVDQEFPTQPGDTCERWLGPAGEHVYHVHLTDDDRWHGYAGGDFIRRKRDVGRAYIALTASHPYWIVTAIASFISQLSPSRLFCVTPGEGLPPELTKALIPISAATPVEASEIEWTRARPDGRHVMQLPLRIDFSDRFLAKLALGVGANLFGNTYCQSSYAEELRSLLWHSDSDAEHELRVRGTGFWHAERLAAISTMVGLTGAWTIFLLALREGYSLYLCTPSGRGMTIVISDEMTRWTHCSFRQYHEGVLYCVIPERRLFVGPVSLPRYIAHQNGTRVDPAIAQLEAFRVDRALLPPRHWAQSTE
jgi:hypothetical protein